MTNHAKGTLDVELKPQPLHHAGAAPPLGRMSIDKQFHGDLEAVSTGEMLSAGTGTPGSAGYVAIERVVGALGGRSGSFVLQHSGTMHGGASQLTITVVPNSGAEGFAGLTGTMTIDIVDGQHWYGFDYTFATPA